MKTKTVDELMEEIRELESSEIYGAVYEAIKLKNKGLGSDIVDEDLVFLTRNPRLMLEFNVLANGLKIVYSGDTVKRWHASDLYDFLQNLYYAQTKIKDPKRIHTKRFNRNKFIKTYNIQERLISQGYYFDEEKEPDKATLKFYKKLKKVKWSSNAKKTNKKIKQVFDKINKKFGTDYVEMKKLIDHIITYLAASNAVNEERNKISSEDVKLAYETLLKLLETDIESVGEYEKKTEEEMIKELEELGEYKGKSFFQLSDKWKNKTLKGLGLSSIDLKRDG